MSDVIIATSTWDALDVIEPFLVHQERLGAAGVLVMDYGSTDGTLDVLRSSRWSGLVTVYDVPSLSSDTSNDLLEIAKADHGADWCFFCDPDEFLVAPHGRLVDLVADVHPSTASIVVPRRNVTGRRSAVTGEDEPGPFHQWLTLRIEGRSDRSRAEIMGATRLTSPWIFTAIPGKVLVRVDRVQAIGPGDHAAAGGREQSLDPETGLLLHFPFRSLHQFRIKMQNAARHWAEDETPPIPGAAWQYKRWLGLREQRALRPEFEQQFVADGDVSDLIAAGVLAEDTRIRDALRGEADQLGDQS